MMVLQIISVVYRMIKIMILNLLLELEKNRIDTIDYKDPLLKQDYGIEVKNFHNWAPYLGKSIEHDFDYKGYKSMVFTVKEIYLNIVVETSYLQDTNLIIMIHSEYPNSYQKKQ